MMDWSQERRLMIGMLSMLMDDPEVRHLVLTQTAAEMREEAIAADDFVQAVEWLTECLMSGKIEEA